MRIPTKLLTLVLLLSGCSRNVDEDPDSGRSLMVTNQWQMEFILIPASGEDWKMHCESRGIDFQPIAAFYLQRSELSRLEFAAAFPDDRRIDLDQDIHPSQTIASWVEAVRLAHAISANDPSFAYRLPTVAEWRYAYYLVHERRSKNLADKIEDMAGENWEFAVKTEMPTAKAAGDTYEPSFDLESFVMTGSPPIHQHSTFTYYASPTLATGDDGIDEYTGLRLVLVPESADAP